MKKQIGVLTSTRAEFGLLKPLIIRLMKEDFCEIKVLVTGAHLSPVFGNTYKVIEEAEIPIAEKLSMKLQKIVGRIFEKFMNKQAHYKNDKFS